ncbi:DUF4181 domain-containing protein [Psychrobacillus sp. OK032]|uniref:DUF4181 domain-containing protein n=1 Tax=Psychrobacillus sp. OK032 TaxID=1884358 RepID=UPI0008D7531A|nr:DUF4181 domain-containing protein [Psychrobacillus sp. OK032]SES07253.1 protein of unknown function [Psychrobacillus sp. OK032]
MIWVKLALFVLVVFVLSTIVKLLLRKLIKIEKEKKSFFSYNHINDLHRKIDWAIRIISTIAFIVTNILIITREYSINLILITSFFYILLDYAVRAFFECKYSQNPKQYILTISEGVLFLLAIVIVIKFDLLINLS